MQHSILCLFICFSFFSCSSKDGKIGADKIIASIRNGEDINYDGSTVAGDVQLIDEAASVMASPTQYNMFVKSALVFRNCTFSGKVVAAMKDKSNRNFNVVFSKSIYFENCTFEEDVNLEGAVINGFCNFLNCTFKKDALFNRSQFNQNSAFTKCQFHKMAGFQYCTFISSVFFNEAHFDGDCFFQNSFAYRDFTFSVVVCDGYTDFSSFNGYSNFFSNYAQFHKGFIFNNGNLRGKTEFVGSKFANAEFEACLFYGPAVFDKSEFTKSLSLKSSKFFAGKPSSNAYKAEKIDITDVQVPGMGMSKMTEF